MGKKEEPEPEFQVLQNPSRVVKAQEKVIKFEHGKIDNPHYSPVLSDRYAGFVILKKWPTGSVRKTRRRKCSTMTKRRTKQCPTPNHSQTWTYPRLSSSMPPTKTHTLLCDSSFLYLCFLTIISN